MLKAKPSSKPKPRKKKIPAGQQSRQSLRKNMPTTGLPTTNNSSHQVSQQKSMPTRHSKSKLKIRQPCYQRIVLLENQSNTNSDISFSHYNDQPIVHSRGVRNDLEVRFWAIGGKGDREVRQGPGNTGLNTKTGHNFGKKLDLNNVSCDSMTGYGRTGYGMTGSGHEARYDATRSGHTSHHYFDKIRHLAATKIQKVFRGFMTRQLLMKYILQEEQQLLARKRVIKEHKTLYIPNINANLLPAKTTIFKTPEVPTGSQNAHCFRSPHSKMAKSNQPSREASPLKHETIRTLPNDDPSMLSQIPEVSVSFDDELREPTFIHKQDNVKTQITEEDQHGNYSQSIIRKPEHSDKFRVREQEKWNQLIGLLKYKIQHDSTLHNESTEFMSALLELSEQNRLSLEIPTNYFEVSRNHMEVPANHMEIPANHMEVPINHMEIPANHIKHIASPPSFKKRLTIDIHGEQPSLQRLSTTFKELPFQNHAAIMPIQNYSPYHNANCHTESLEERTFKLKQHFLAVNDDNDIEDMLKIRQELLARREEAEIMRLQACRQSGRITESQFFSQLQQIVSKYKNRRQLVEQSKKHIYQGYRASIELARETVLDAKVLGYVHSFCQSMRLFKGQVAFRFDNTMVDELSRFVARRKGAETAEDSSLTNNSLSMDASASTMLMNGSVSSLEADKTAQIQPESVQVESPRVQTSEPHKEVYQLQDSPQSSTEEMLYDETADNRCMVLAQYIFETILLEIYREFTPSRALTFHFLRKHEVAPLKVIETERELFIKFISQRILHSETISTLHRRLNQRIHPTFCELLAGMRGPEEEFLPQLSNFEYPIGTEDVNAALEQLLKVNRQIEQEYVQDCNSKLNVEFERLENYPVPGLKQVINQRQLNFLKRKSHCSQLRQQILKIEAHCLGDAWNEQIIRLKEESGVSLYTGIGLNELTCCLQSNGPPLLALSEVEPFLSRTLKSIRFILSENLATTEKIDKEEKEDIQGNNGAWISYGNEALEFCLGMVGLLEEQLIIELLMEMEMVDHCESLQSDLGSELSDPQDFVQLLQRDASQSDSFLD